MKNTIKRILCLLAAGVLLSGCSAVEVNSGSGVNVIDVGQYSDAAPPDGNSEVTAPPTEHSAGSTTAPTETAPVEIVTTVPAQTTTAATTTAATTTATTTTAATTTAATTTAATTTAATTTATTTAATTTAATTTATTAKPEPVQPTESSYTALNYDEVQGVWISYLEYIDFMQGKSGSEFRSAISQALDNCSELGLNTVYVHARSHGDAYYNSELFPWSKYVTGSFGAAPDYDPLQVIIEEAHERSISVQAWINPLRLCGKSDISSYGDYAAADWHSDPATDGKYIVEVNGYYYLNPAYEEVVRLIADGAAEIVENYDVDGLHIDDYFYPTTEAWFDSAAFTESGYTDLASFRFDNCDYLVESIYSAVKAANSTALFSVSCQGSIENNYDKMYADVEKWCTESGYLDYIVPQIYYGFENSTQPYFECLLRWNSMCERGNIPLVVGLSVYKIGIEDTWAGEGKQEWITDTKILARQLSAARECASYGGASLYSYRSIYSCDSGVEEQVWNEIAEFTALILI